MRSTGTTLSAVALLALTACGGTTTTTTETDADAPGAMQSPTSEASTGTSTPAAEEVVVDSCGAGDPGQVTADLTVTNTSDSPKSYVITVSVNGPGGARVAEATAAADSVPAGQSVQVQAQGAAAEPPAELTCEVADASRF
ncbi:FxLYD domain-containing protein [Kineococcus sp. SYSU DK018]|uniref:FxLYD domain-containing protein n=1 Tax=Kineococcus sp. SYSU DK018 TaxID=3383139 RepID=UPI003D7E1090